jgi:hypothetical protein
MKVSSVFSSLVLSVSVFVLSGCNQPVKVVDGKVPAQYLPQAQAVMGNYVGSFGGVATTLTATLKDDRVVLTSSVDLLGAYCGSSFGLLTSAWATGSSDQDASLTEATFDFNAGKCSAYVLGQSVTLSFNSPTQFSMQLLDHMDQVEHCEVVGGPYPHQECRMESVPVYVQGDFKRAN